MTVPLHAIVCAVVALLFGPTSALAIQRDVASLGDALSSGSRAIVERRYEDALATLDDALRDLPVTDGYWAYLMERALVAELQLRRWSALDRRFALIDEVDSASWREDLRSGIADTRVAALLKMGLPDMAEDAAMEQLDAALAAHDGGSSNRTSVANAWARVVDIDLGLQRLDRAIERANAALSHEALAGHVSARVRLLRMRGRAEFQQERYDPTRARAARATWEEALALVEEGDELRGLLALDHVIHREYDAAESHLAAIREGRADTLALAVSARWARETERAPDVLAETTANVLSALDELMGQWKDVEPGKGGLGRLLFVKDRMLLSEALLATVNRAGPAAALELYARVEASGTAAMRLGVDGQNTVDRVRQALSNRHGVLVFTPLVTGGASVFALDRHGVVHARSPSYHEVEVRRREWVRRVQPGTPDVMARDESRWALDLGDHLLPESIRRAMDEWDAISVCGLDLLPVAWLATSTAEGVKRWGEVWALDRWPSLPVIAASADMWAGEMVVGVQGEPKPVALFASPSGPSRAVRERWPFVEQMPDARSVVSDMRRRHANVEAYVGDASAATAFVEVARDGRGLLEFVGHGVRDARMSDSTMLLFASEVDVETSLLSSDTLRALVQRSHTTAETVLLLACRSGRATERLGDAGAVGLAGAWLTAGARAVLTAGSDITFDTAEEVSAFVNGELVGGVSLAEALRRRREQLIAKFGDAAVQRSGLLDAHGLAQRASVRPLPKATSAVTWGVAALVAIVLLVGFSRRR